MNENPPMLVNRSITCIRNVYANIIARLSFIFTTLFIHFAFEWQTRIKIFDERSPVTGSEISFLVFPYLFFTLLTVHFFFCAFYFFINFVIFRSATFCFWIFFFLVRNNFYSAFQFLKSSIRHLKWQRYRYAAATMLKHYTRYLTQGIE